MKISLNQLHVLKQVVGIIVVHVNNDKTIKF